MDTPIVDPENPSTGEESVVSNILKENVLTFMKKGIFNRNRLKQTYQLAKLIYNGEVYTFKARTHGAIMLDSEAINWYFVLPDREDLDISTKRDMTVTDFLTFLIDYCIEHPIPAWDEFGQWLFDGEMDEMVQALINAVILLRDGDYSTNSIPMFSMPDGSITNVISWLLEVERALDPDNCRYLHTFAVNNNEKRLQFPFTITILDSETETTTDAIMTFTIQQ